VILLYPINFRSEAGENPHYSRDEVRACRIQRETLVKRLYAAGLDITMSLNKEIIAGTHDVKGGTKWIYRLSARAEVLERHAEEMENHLKARTSSAVITNPNTDPNPTLTRILTPDPNLDPDPKPDSKPNREGAYVVDSGGGHPGLETCNGTLHPPNKREIPRGHLQSLQLE